MNKIMLVKKQKKVNPKKTQDKSIKLSQERNKQTCI